jgi:hypothetical protein
MGFTPRLLDPVRFGFGIRLAVSYGVRLESPFRPARASPGGLSLALGDPVGFGMLLRHTGLLAPGETLLFCNPCTSAAAYSQYTSSRIGALLKRGTVITLPAGSKARPARVGCPMTLRHPTRLRFALGDSSSPGPSTLIGFALHLSVGMPLHMGATPTMAVSITYTMRLRARFLITPAVGGSNGRHQREAYRKANVDRTFSP